MSFGGGQSLWGEAVGTEKREWVAAEKEQGEMEENIVFTFCVVS